MSKGFKIFSIVMALTFALSVAGCQQTPSTPSASNPVDDSRHQHGPGCHVHRRNGCHRPRI